MKQVLTKLYTDQRIFASVCVGITAALVQAGLIADWSTLIAVALFTPFDSLKG